ncbi:MAG: hypothetical protein QOI71_1847 [Gaiellales bacterium]|nr:hypothetical protein [Gaiellales bacterium]
MPRRPPSRRTLGVLAAVLLVAAGAALSTARHSGGVARAAAPLPPMPKGSLLERFRVVLPRLVLDRAEARQHDFDVQSNTFDNQYPPNLEATFRQPLPGQTPNSPMMTEFFAGGFILGKAENLQGRSRPGNVVVVVWAFTKPEGAYRSLRALRDLSGLHSSPSRFAPGAIVLSLPGTGASDLLWVRGRALVRATSSISVGGSSMARARDAVARAIDAKIRAEPLIAGYRLAAVEQHDLSTLAGRLGSLRIAENDLPGGLDTVSWTVTPRPGARDRLHRDGAALRLQRRFAALGLRGGATQIISVAQIHGSYVTYAWAFPSAAAAQDALRAVRSQAGVRSAPGGAVRAATRVIRPGALLRDDLFWVRGTLLLQVGAYGPRGIPLLQSRQELVAVRLDSHASLLA